MEWIKVEEHRPEEGIAVLLFNVPLPEKLRQLGIDGPSKPYMDVGFIRHLTTHWMPLPEPPGEKDEVD